MKRGFTLIDAVVAMGLLFLVLAALADAVEETASVVSVDKTKSAALGVLSEKMEGVRLLSYDDVGLAGGTPSGSLRATDNETVNGLQYSITTAVGFIDDPADGTGAADSDGADDYKSVRVTVSWTGPKGAENISATTYRMPGT